MDKQHFQSIIWVPLGGKKFIQIFGWKFLASDRKPPQEGNS